MRLVILLLACVLAFQAHARTGRLGFTIDFSADRTALDARLKQVVVTAVAKDSPAERAGLRAGDVLDGLGGQPLAGSSARQFFGQMGKVKPGDRVVLVVLRAGKPLSLTLVAE